MKLGNIFFNKERIRMLQRKKFKFMCDDKKTFTYYCKAVSQIQQVSFSCQIRRDQNQTTSFLTSQKRQRQGTGTVSLNDSTVLFNQSQTPVLFIQSQTPVLFI